MSFAGNYCGAFMCCPTTAGYLASAGYVSLWRCWLHDVHVCGCVVVQVGRRVWSGLVGRLRDVPGRCDERCVESDNTTQTIKTTKSTKSPSCGDDFFQHITHNSCGVAMSPPHRRRNGLWMQFLCLVACVVVVCCEPTPTLDFDPYEALGVSPDATNAQIRRAFRKLVRRQCR